MDSDVWRYLKKTRTPGSRDFFLSRETDGGGSSDGRRSANDAASAQPRSVTRECTLSTSLRDRRRRAAECKYAASAEFSGFSGLLI